MFSIAHLCLISRYPKQLLRFILLIVTWAMALVCSLQTDAPGITEVQLTSKVNAFNTQQLQMPLYSIGIRLGERERPVY